MRDVLEVLRQGDLSVDPGPEFAAELFTRLVEEWEALPEAEPVAGGAPVDLVPAARPAGRLRRRRHVALTAAAAVAALALPAVLLNEPQPTRDELRVGEPQATPTPAPAQPTPLSSPAVSLEDPAPPVAPGRALTGASGPERRPAGLPRRQPPAAPAPVAQAMPRPVAPAWAAVYASDSGDSYDLYLDRLDGSEPEVLSAGPRFDVHPTVSPDARTVAFSYNGAADEPNQLRLLDLESRRITRIWGDLRCSTSCIDTWPTWSPDSQQLVFSNGSAYSGCTAFDECPRLYVTNRDGTGLRELTTGDFPAWQPNGRLVAFMDHDGAGGPDGCDYTGAVHCPDGSLFVIDVDTGARRSLGVQGWGPRWSPDGTTIAYESSASGTAQVHTVRVDGTGARQVTAGTRHMQPNWAPDGTLACVASPDGTPDVYLLEQDGSLGRRLTDTPGFEAQFTLFRPRG